MRWDPFGVGIADDGHAREVYEAAFPEAANTMGCEGFCLGYELTRNLDFNSDGSYASGVVNKDWTTGAGWMPIYSDRGGFNATFEGNGFTIANLYIKRRGASDTGSTGLFGFTRREFAHIRRIGLISVDVRGESRVGGLVGHNEGRITESYVSGRVQGDKDVGGLVGHHFGEIRNSHSSGKVSGSTNVGGLVGTISGNSPVTLSFSNAYVTGIDLTGGLAGSELRRSHSPMLRHRQSDGKDRHRRTGRTQLGHHHCYIRHRQCVRRTYNGRIDWGKRRHTHCKLLHGENEGEISFRWPDWRKWRHLIRRLFHSENVGRTSDRRSGRHQRRHHHRKLLGHRKIGYVGRRRRGRPQ